MSTTRAPKNQVGSALRECGNRPPTDVPFPSLLGTFALRLLTTTRAQQRAGGALSTKRASENQVESALLSMILPTPYP